MNAGQTTLTIPVARVSTELEHALATFNADDPVSPLIYRVERRGRGRVAPRDPYRRLADPG